RRRGHGVASAVVDDLDEHVPRRARHDETGAFGGADDPLAQSGVPTVALSGLAHGGQSLPALPALRRTTAPAVRTPFPLYGSRLRSLRMLAATSPTACLSMPRTVSLVLPSTSNVMPAGGLTVMGCE